MHILCCLPNSGKNVAGSIIKRVIEYMAMVCVKA